MYGMYGYGYGYGLDPTIILVLIGVAFFSLGSGTCKFHVLEIFQSPQHDWHDRRGGGETPFKMRRNLRCDGPADRR